MKGELVGGWTNPTEKYAQVKLDHLPKDRGKNTKHLWNHLENHSGPTWKNSKTSVSNLAVKGRNPVYLSLFQPILERGMYPYPNRLFELSYLETFLDKESAAKGGRICIKHLWYHATITVFIKTSAITRLVQSPRRSCRQRAEYLYLSSGWIIIPLHHVDWAGFPVLWAYIYINLFNLCIYI